MESKKSRNIYYSLFFIGYFLSIDLGERRNSRESGIYFVTILLIGFCFSITFVMIFFGVRFNAKAAMLASSGVVVILNYWIFRSSFVKRVLPEFSHMGEDSYKAKRRFIGIMSFAIFMILTIGTALINNQAVREYLTNW